MHLSQGHNRIERDTDINVKGGINNMSSKKVHFARFIPVNNDSGRPNLGKNMNITPTVGNGRRGITPPKKRSDDEDSKKSTLPKRNESASDAKNNQNDLRKKNLTSSKRKECPRPTTRASQKSTDIPISLPKRQPRKTNSEPKNNESIRSCKFKSYKKKVFGLRPNKPTNVQPVQRNVRDSPIYLTKKLTCSKRKEGPKPTTRENQKSTDNPASLPKSQQRKTAPKLKSNKSIQSCRSCKSKSHPNKPTNNQLVQRDVSGSPRYLSFRDKKVSDMLSTWRLVVVDYYSHSVPAVII